jgi:xanthine dehydrogenase accessory factor
VTEALQAIAVGRDRTVLFGDGSPFFDIVLPCGGGINVSIHLLRDIEPIKGVLRRLELREAAGLRYLPDTESIISVAPASRSGWCERQFVIVYRPATRLVISGQTIEADAVARLAGASGFDVVFEGDQPGAFSALSIDPYTAVVLLHHDLDREERVLVASLRSSAFYIGALGSTRTHRRRVDRLKSQGHYDSAIERIKAPIGIFGPTRDAASLAISVLGDVVAARLAAYA